MNEEERLQNLYRQLKFAEETNDDSLLNITLKQIEQIEEGTDEEIH